MNTVAQTPKTVAEIMQFMQTPERIRELTIAQLEEIHATITEQGTSKPAKHAASLIGDILNSKRKEERKGKAEPVANSVKASTTSTATTPAASKRKGATVSKPAAAKAAVAKTPATPATPPKAGTTLPKAAAAGKAGASKPVVKKAEEMTPAELLAYTKELELKTEKFPAVIETEKASYNRIAPANVQELSKYLVTAHYSIYCFLDERIDDNLTQCLIVYASDKLILGVDKNRQKETHIEFTPSCVSEGVMTLKEGTQTLTFPLAFYEREVKK